MKERWGLEVEMQWCCGKTTGWVEGARQSLVYWTKSHQLDWSSISVEAPQTDITQTISGITRVLLSNINLTLVCDGYKKYLHKFWKRVLNTEFKKREVDRNIVREGIRFQYGS